jgi:hypothetical protein
MINDNSQKALLVAKPKRDTSNKRKAFFASPFFHIPACTSQSKISRQLELPFRI